MEINDLINCSKDFSYFVENKIKIKTFKKELISIKLFDYQKTIIEEYLREENKFVIIPKFRQGGFTTTNELFSLWSALFKKNKNIVFFFSSRAALDDVRNKILSIIDSSNLNENIKEEDNFYIKINDNYINFKTHDDLIKSRTNKQYTEIFVEECDSWLNENDLNKLNGEKLFLISSFSIGISNMFKDIVYKLKNNKKINRLTLNNSKLLEIPFYKNINYKKLNKLEEIKNLLGERAFNLEILCKLPDDYNDN